MIKIVFPDLSEKEFKKGVTPFEIANSISLSLAKKCMVAKLNDELIDMSQELTEDGKIELILGGEDGYENLLNHSCAHMLAQAIKQLYPNAMFGVGPAIEEGFYYDIDLGDIKLNEEDLPKIEKKMQALAASGETIHRVVVSKEKALELFSNDIYKKELIEELEDTTTITIYKQGDFYDLCRGPHVSSTKWLKNFKLLSISGAYWRGDAKNHQLQRIYGTCFATETALKEHLISLEERKKRDHRKLGKELDLFMISEFGPGFPFWLPNGMILRRNLENFWYKIHTEAGYQFVQTPIMLNKELWEISGHWYNYKENMYTSVIDEKEFAIKPMNCPGGMLVYKNDIHSYRDFPLRIGELGLVHRHEASGALNGLFRVRNFTQDDAHIFITEEQIEEEIERLENTIVKPAEKVNELLKNNNSSPLTTGVKMSELLRRTEMNYEMLGEIDENRKELPKDVTEEVEIEVKYKGYIKLQQAQVEKFKRLEAKLLPQDIDYSTIKGLRLEARQKLNKIKPNSVGQASRISGVSPADISVLLLSLIHI